MENTSLLSDDDVWYNVTTSSSESDQPRVPVSLLSNLTLKVIFIIVGTVGVLDNLFVLVVFVLLIKISDKTMNILIVNQSVIDLLASLFTLMSAVLQVERTGMSSGSVYDQFICRIWISLKPMWCMLVTSTYGIILTTLDRYIAVIYPIWYSNNLKVRKRLVYCGIAFIWVVIPTCEIMASVLSYDIVKGICMFMADYRSFAVEKIIGFTIIMVSYLFPQTLMLFCYTRIVKVLRTKVGPAANAAIVKAGRNATVTAMLICCGFIVCWSANEIMFFLSFVGVNIDRTIWFYHFTIVCWFYHFAFVLVIANSCINPLIYAAKYGEFQKGLSRVLPKKIQPSTQATANTN